MNNSKFDNPMSRKIPSLNRQTRTRNSDAITIHHRSRKLGASLLVGCWSLVLLSGSRAGAQSYSIDWYKIAGGGGTSIGGTYQVSGTIGQPDAGGPLVGGGYSVTGGFWSLFSVVQMPGVPNLLIVPNGTHSVKILWPAPATNTYTLQQNANLALAAWSASGYIITNGFGTNFCTITAPTGKLFFRLSSF